MRHFSLLSLVLLVSAPCSTWADNTPNSSNSENKIQAVSSPASPMESVQDASPAEAPEDKVYQEKVLQLSNAISEKIAAVQAKQKELDEEIYPASKPPIQTELEALNKQLSDLKMQKEQLDAQKTASDMAKKLNNAAASGQKK